MVNNVRFLWMENNVLSYIRVKQVEGTTNDPFRRFVVTASSLTRRIKGWRDRREGRIKRFPDKLCWNSATILCIGGRIRWENEEEGREMFEIYHVTKRTENCLLASDTVLSSYFVLFRINNQVKCTSSFHSQFQNVGKYMCFIYSRKIYTYLLSF